jgi:hypothetical protein
LWNWAFVGVTNVLTYQNARNEQYKSERLRECKKKVLWRIFGHKRDEGIEEWIKLNNEELYCLYASPNTVGLSNQEEREGRAM